MAQRRRDESPPESVNVAEPANTESVVKDNKSNAAPVKDSVTLTLTGAASYHDLNLKIGPFRKGQSFSVESGKAEALLKTGMFKKV